MEKPTKDQLAENVKISNNWIRAVSSGTFSGIMAIHVATLLDFLTKQHDEAKAQYEAMVNPPEWNKPVLHEVGK